MEEASNLPAARFLLELVSVLILSLQYTSSFSSSMALSDDMSSLSDLRRWHGRETVNRRYKLMHRLTCFATKNDCFPGSQEMSNTHTIDMWDGRRTISFLSNFIFLRQREEDLLRIWLGDSILQISGNVGCR